MFPIVPPVLPDDERGHDRYRRRLSDPDGFFADAELMRRDPIGNAFVWCAERLADRIKWLRLSLVRKPWVLLRPIKRQAKPKGSTAK